MIRHRVRIRFRKEGDLRWISHRDLVRTFERLLRRAEVPLSMSEGFHPKPRMTFPAALALGIAGAEEVLEFEVAQPVDESDLMVRLSGHCPPGLSITSLRLLASDERKARVERVTYSIPLPPERCPMIESAIALLPVAEPLIVHRDGRPRSVTLGEQPVLLQVVAGELRFRIAGEGPAIVRPRELLALLGLADLEHEGCVLTRTHVELESLPHNYPTDKNRAHENGNADQCLATGGMPDCAD
jgi:radical SAM-linked protein